MEQHSLFHKSVPGMNTRAELRNQEYLSTLQKKLGKESFAKTSRSEFLKQQKEEYLKNIDELKALIKKGDDELQQLKRFREDDILEREKLLKKRLKNDAIELEAIKREREARMKKETEAIMEELNELDQESSD